VFLQKCAILLTLIEQATTECDLESHDDEILRLKVTSRQNCYSKTDIHWALNPRPKSLSQWQEPTEEVTVLYILSRVWG
jgi:hypothetical protein